MNEALNGEIIPQKFPGLDHELQDTADRLMVILEDLDGFPVGQAYTYEDGVVAVDLSMISTQEQEHIVSIVENSKALQEGFTTNTGTKIGEDGTDVVTLFLEKK
jgi:hypothetical protein